MGISIQPNYEKAIAVGMAGILLVFVAIYLSIGILGINTAPTISGTDDHGNLKWVIVVVIVTMLCMFLIGFAAACVASDDLSSRKDAMKASSISGLVPMSLVIVGILYLILYLGIWDALPFFIAGIGFVIVGIGCSAIGGAIGYEVACIYLKPDPLLQ